MHDDSVLIAVEDALRRSVFCTCGKPQHLDTHDGAIWLECTAFEQPSRLPKALALFVREIGHDRRLVIDLPEADDTPLAA